MNKGTKNKTPLRVSLLSVLALSGGVVGVFLSKHYYGLRAGTEGFRSYCNLGEGMNCDAVALSPYADVFSGWPLSSFVAGWFFAIFIVSLIAHSASWRREALRVAFAMTGFALGASLYYFFVMMTVIKSFCLLCLVVDGISLLSFVVVASLWKEVFDKASVDWKKWRTLGPAAMATLFVSVIFLKGMEAKTLDAGTMRILVDQVVASPSFPVSSGPEFPSIGPEDAPIKIVEFADFQCPSCRVGAVTVKSLMNRYPGKIRLTFRNFPLHPACNSAVQRGNHGASCEAARAVWCADREGKFEEVYEELFARQLALAPGRVADFAKAAGASDDLRVCMDSPEAAQAVVADTEEGIRLNVRSTPTFFINGRKVEGAYPLDAWVRIVEHFLKQ